MRNKEVKDFFIISIFSIAILIFIVIVIIYNENYKTKTIDTNRFSKGNYTVELKNIGEPEFPFGDTTGKIVLKNNGIKISEKKFKIADDGAVLSKNNWRVKWDDNGAKILLRASEQCDEVVEMKFNGKILTSMVDVTNSKIKEDYRFTSSKDDSKEYEDEQKKELEKVKQEYESLFNYLIKAKVVRTNQKKAKFDYNAKGEIYLKVGEEKVKQNEELLSISYTAVFNNNGGSDDEDEFVLYKNKISKDGVNIDTTEILGFYLVNKKTLKVTDERKNTW